MLIVPEFISVQLPVCGWCFVSRRGTAERILSGRARPPFRPHIFQNPLRVPIIDEDSPLESAIRPSPVSRPGALGVLAFGWVVATAWAQVAYGDGGGDATDVVGVWGVWILMSVTWAMASEGWIGTPGWGRSVKERFGEFLSRYDLQTGIDFGGAPEYEHRVPPALIHMAAGLLGALLVGLLVRDAFPGPMRDVLLSVSPMLYLVYAALIWGWSLFFALSACAVVGVHINDLVINRQRFEGRERLWRGLLGTLLVTAPILAAVFLPAWLPVVLIAAGAGAGLVVLLNGQNGQIRFLWRTRGTQEIHAVGSSWLLGWGDLSLAGLIALTVIPTTGGVWAGSAGSAPITAGVGLFVGWCGVFALWTWLWAGPVRLFRLARRDPARALLSALEFTADRPEASAEATLVERGFRVLQPGEDIVHRVRVQLDASATRREVKGVEASSGDVVWRVHPQDLLNSHVLSELRAADRLMRRRELVRGIRRLLTSAKARKFKSGSGFWFAPHLWYVPAMSRDTDEDSSMTVGPPYHRMLSAEARQHAHQVFTAVQIDLVFIEDGVPVPGVERVLLQVFDHYDLWGVDVIEDRHLFSIPGTRVFIHSFEFGAPLDEEGYPEPDYENLARARVLHVMKDRGGGGDGDPLESLPTEIPKSIPVSTL